MMFTYHGEEKDILQILSMSRREEWEKVHTLNWIFLPSSLNVQISWTYFLFFYEGDTTPRKKNKKISDEC